MQDKTQLIADLREDIKIAARAEQFLKSDFWTGTLEPILAKEQADGQSMKNLELSGELMRRSDVKTSWANMALSFKEKVRSAPLVALTQIPGFSKPMAKKLAEILDVALVELADGGTRNRTGKRSPRPRARDPRAAKAAAQANGKPVG